MGQPEDVVYDHTLDVQLGSPAVSKSVYLAYGEGDGGEGRVGVVTVHLHVLSSRKLDSFVISFRVLRCLSSHCPVSRQTTL